MSSNPKPVFAWQGATLSQKHGVSVESVVMKHDHKVVAGPPKSQLTAEEAKDVAIKKAIALAVHKVLPLSLCCAWCVAARLVSRYSCLHARFYILVFDRLVLQYVNSSAVVNSINSSAGVSCRARASVTGVARTRQARLCLVEGDRAVGVSGDGTRKRSCTDTPRHASIQKGAAAVKAADADPKSGKRGRGGAQGERKTDEEIKALAKQMRQSIKALDGKIQKLDESPAAPLRSPRLAALALLAALVALVSAH